LGTASNFFKNEPTDLLTGRLIARARIPRARRAVDMRAHRDEFRVDLEAPSAKVFAAVRV
jgi:hypothetical protein